MAGQGNTIMVTTGSDGPPCPDCARPTELRGKSRTPYCRNCHQFIQDGLLGDCRSRKG